MLRRTLSCLTLFALVGCKGSDILKPSASPPSSPSFLISDGAHLAGGNPDFFFLPPMVKNPNKSPNWDAGAFNGNLTPNVDICELEATTEVQVNAGAPCKSGGYALSAVASVNLGAEHYQLNWKVPDSQQNSHKFYKIKVRVGTTQLGFADVEAASNSSRLKNVNSNEFIAMNDGQNLPIKFRIERFALCTVAGVGPCTSVVVNLQTGGTVSTILPGGTLPSGVTIPPQPNGGSVTITLQSCLSLNPRAIDLPVFGPCLSVTSEPPLESALQPAATVFVCDVVASAIIGTNVASAAQKERITLHRLDVGGEAQTVTALPHAPACGVVLGAAGASVKGFFASLAHGRWKSAGGHLLALIGPKPLYAARRIDEGGGGFTPGFSDFQFALPAKMLKDPATDGQTALPGTTLPLDPAVDVTDLGNEPVKGATVRFATSDGSVAPPSVVTGVDGRAHAAWTLSTTAGPNSLKASGRGIAGADFNGPRGGVELVDPFQPIQFFFDGTEVGAGPVTVLTGSQTFSATGVTGWVRVAGVGANSGNQAANDVFSFGDLPGTIARLDVPTFNALTPAQLRTAYDVLIITWSSATLLNVDWATRLLPYLRLGGGVIYDGDPNNIGDLTAVVTASLTNLGGESATGISVTTPVAGLTDGIGSLFVNNHIEFASFPTWDPALSPFLKFTSGPNTGAVVGLYGRFAAGCIVLTGPDQDFHAVRPGNQYNLLVNEIRFVRSCP